MLFLFSDTAYCVVLSWGAWLAFHRTCDWDLIIALHLLGLEEGRGGGSLSSGLHRAIELGNALGRISRYDVTRTKQPHCIHLDWKGVGREVLGGSSGVEGRGVTFIWPPLPL